MQAQTIPTAHADTQSRPLLAVAAIPGLTSENEGTLQFHAVPGSLILTGEGVSLVVHDKDEIRNLIHIDTKAGVISDATHRRLCHELNALVEIDGRWAWVTESTADCKLGEEYVDLAWFLAVVRTARIVEVID